MKSKLLRQFKIDFSNEVTDYYHEILTDDASVFITDLHEKFNPRRPDFLKSRLVQ